MLKCGLKLLLFVPDKCWCRQLDSISAQTLMNVFLFWWCSQRVQFCRSARLCCKLRLLLLLKWFKTTMTHHGGLSKCCRHVGRRYLIVMHCLCSTTVLLGLHLLSQTWTVNLSSVLGLVEEAWVTRSLVSLSQFLSSTVVTPDRLWCLQSHTHTHTNSSWINSCNIAVHARKHTSAMLIAAVLRVLT